MALKAGLVGVNPKGVDKNGMPIGSAGNAVEEAQLTANGKQFHFAYDETSDKYGYKLDGAGDFIPFESGGAGLILPDPSVAGITTSDAALVIDSGGYQVIDGTTYIDLTLKNTSASNVSASINGLPHRSSGVYGLWFIDGVNSAYVSINSSGSTGNQFIAAGATIRLVSIF